MENKLSATISININKPALTIWNALTNPEIIKKYFFGTEAISEWKQGSPLHFKGIWDGKEYLDKGTILEFIPEKFLRYNYLSSFSGLEDRPENYSIVSYSLTTGTSDTKLVIVQDNIATEEARAHSEKNWEYILNELKKLLDSSNQ